MKLELDDALYVAATHVSDIPMPDHFVPRLVRYAAEWGAKWVAEQLGVSRPLQIRWAKSSIATVGVKASSRVHGDTIWILEDAVSSLSEAAATGAHEAYHCHVDDDETNAEAFQRAAKAAWSSERYEQRAQLWAELAGIYHHACPDDVWEREAGGRRVADWYGAKSIGFTSAIVLAARDLKLRQDELDELTARDPLAHLKRAGQNARPVYNYEREIR